MDCRETRVETEGPTNTRLWLSSRWEGMVTCTRLVAVEWSSSEYILKVEAARFLGWVGCKLSPRAGQSKAYMLF